MTQTVTQPREGIQVRDPGTNQWVDVGAAQNALGNKAVPVTEEVGRVIESSQTELLLAIREELGEIKMLLQQLVS